MSYFNYHAKAKNLIRTGHCIDAKIVEAHKNISPALILFFDNHQPMPIREYRWVDYVYLLTEYNVKIHYLPRTKKTR